MNSIVLNKSKANEIQREGEKILGENKFFSDLCVLMKNVEFIRIYDEYFSNWSDIECMVFYMKLYSTVQYEYKLRYNIEISDEIMCYVLKNVMSNKSLRSVALELFKNFEKSVGMQKTKHFRTLLVFEKKLITSGHN